MSVTLIACDIHVAMGRDDRALRLAAVVKEAEGRRLLSITSPFLCEHRHAPLQPLPQHQHVPSAIGGSRCHGSPPSSRFRLWISFEKHPRQSFKFFAHFHSPSTEILPTTSPRDLVSAARLTVIDTREEHRCPDRLRPPPVRSRAAISPGTPQHVSLPKNLWLCPIPVNQKVTTSGEGLE
jgi:hypothetical protein